MLNMNRSANILSGYDAIVGSLASDRPSVTNIWSEIFPNMDESSHCGQLIGVEGLSGTGKSMLLYQSLTHTLAPFNWGGQQSQALLMDLTHRNGWRVIQKQLELLARNSGESLEATGQTTSEERQMELLGFQEKLDQALRSLILYDCYSNEQLTIALKTLDNLLWSNGAIALIAIDGLDSFYWDIGNPRRRERLRYVTYCQELLQRIREVCVNHKVCCLYTLEKNTEAVSSLMKSVNDFNIVLTYDRNSGLRTLNERPIVIKEKGIEFVNICK